MCHVGYLPCRLLRPDDGRRFDGMFLLVKEDLRTSDNSAERSRSHRNYGVVYCHDISSNHHLIGKSPFDGENISPKFVKYLKKSASVDSDTNNEDVESSSSEDTGTAGACVKEIFTQVETGFEKENDGVEEDEKEEEICGS